MKKTKSVTWDEVRADLMSDPEVQAGMEAIIIKASLDTIARYARACEIKHPQIIL